MLDYLYYSAGHYFWHSRTLYLSFCTNSAITVLAESCEDTSSVSNYNGEAKTVSPLYLPPKTARADPRSRNFASRPFQCNGQPAASTNYDASKNRGGFPFGRSSLTRWAPGPFAAIMP
jgi:hypothetical protein